jgi:hypothetical protein
MAVTVICGYKDEDYENYKWLFDDGHFDSDDVDYIIDGGIYWTVDDMVNVQELCIKLEVSDSLIKEIDGRIYGVTYHG